MSLDCIRVSDAIWDSVRNGSELTAEELDHVQSCGSCTVTLAQAQAAVPALNSLKPCPPTPDCRQQVMSQVNAAKPIVALRRLAWVIAPAVAAVALVAVLYNGSPKQITRHTVKQPIKLAGVEKPKQPRVVTPSPKPEPKPAQYPAPSQLTLAPSMPAPTRKPKIVKTLPAQNPEQAVKKQLPDGFRPGYAGCSTQAALDRSSKLSAAELAKLMKEEQAAFRKMLQSQTDQISTLIERTSDSSFLMKSGPSASPSGNVSRLQKWGNLPFSSIYAVSQPFETSLPVVGFGKILGAATILDYEDSGTYLVFLPIQVQFTADETVVRAKPDSVLLLSAKVDKSGAVTYTQRAKTVLIEHAVPECRIVPSVSVSYENTGAVIEMSWEEESYRFIVNQQFIFL